MIAIDKGSFVCSSCGKAGDGLESKKDERFALYLAESHQDAWVAVILGTKGAYRQLQRSSPNPSNSAARDRQTSCSMWKEKTTRGTLRASPCRDIFLRKFTRNRADLEHREQNLISLEPFIPLPQFSFREGPVVVPISRAKACYYPDKLTSFFSSVLLSIAEAIRGFEIVSRFYRHASVLPPGRNDSRTHLAYFLFIPARSYTKLSAALNT